MILPFIKNLTKFSKIVFVLFFTLCCNIILEANTSETKLVFSNQSTPLINIDTEIDTLIALDTTGLAKILKVEAFDDDGSKLPVTTTLSWHEQPRSNCQKRKISCLGPSSNGKIFPILSRK